MGSLLALLCIKKKDYEIYVMLKKKKISSHQLVSEPDVFLLE
jgi:hypothetical protein